MGHLRRQRSLADARCCTGARLGGYAREFFVSQTSELTVMADVVIDVAGLARSREGGMRVTELSAPSIGGTVPV
jgi:hypothetical protein